MPILSNRSNISVPINRKSVKFSSEDLSSGVGSSSNLTNSSSSLSSSNSTSNLDSSLSSNLSVSIGSRISKDKLDLINQLNYYNNLIQSIENFKEVFVKFNKINYLQELIVNLEEVVLYTNNNLKLELASDLQSEESKTKSTNE